MSIKKKLSNKKVLSTVFALAAVAIIFSFFPSCGKNKEVVSVATEPHAERVGHTKTVPSGTVGEDPEHIDDISFSIGLTEEGSPESVEVRLLYSSEGEGSEKEEVTLSGEFSETGSGMSANFSSEGELPVNGSANCITPECTVINFLIQYRDGDGDLKTVTRLGARGIMEVEEPSAEDLESGTAQGNVFVPGFNPALLPTASERFLAYWNEYLATLEFNHNKPRGATLPRGLILDHYNNQAGTFIILNPEVPADNIFARPINMRKTQNFQLDGEPVRIDGILINGEPLLNDSTKCVVWAEGFNNDNRYASSILNAVLSFVGPELKSEETCATLYLGEASKINGGQLEGETNHQNGLDVNISYTSSDPFSEIEVENHAAWNLMALKAFYETGMVSRFVTSPEIKAAFVQYAKEQGSLDSYRAALAKVYPEAGFGNTHYKLEIGCAADNILENVWCTDTSARIRTWPVEWCDDQVCMTSGPEGDSTSTQIESPNRTFSDCTEAQKRSIDEEEDRYTSLEECKLESEGQAEINAFIQNAEDAKYTICNYERGKICRFKEAVPADATERSADQADDQIPLRPEAPDTPVPPVDTFSACTEEQKAAVDRGMEEPERFSFTECKDNSSGTDEINAFVRGSMRDGYTSFCIYENRTCRFNLEE